MATNIIIIEQISSTEVIVQCARCYSTGRIGKYSDSPACKVCNGKGKLLIEIDRLPLVECSRCYGTGRIGQYYDSPICSSCGGAGCQPIAGNMRIIK